MILNFILLVAALGCFLKLEEYKLIIDKFSVPASPFAVLFLHPLF
jgi:hypothetical protein